MNAQNAAAVDQVKSLIEITHSLNKIFVQENTLLTSQRPREIAPLQAEKARLVAAYAQSIRDIAASRTKVRGADTALLSKLRSITKTFEKRAAEQHALLDGATRAVKGVVQAVAAEAAADAVKPGYQKPSGATSAAPISPVAPISIDENA